MLVLVADGCFLCGAILIDLCMSVAAMKHLSLIIVVLLFGSQTAVAQGVVTVELVVPSAKDTPQNTVYFEEPDGQLCVCVRIAQSSSGVQLEKTLTLVLNTIEDTAEEAVDYFPIINRPIEFEPGNENAVICTNIVIFDDYFCEEDESFVVSLTSTHLDGFVVLDPDTSELTVVIHDDNSQPCTVPMNGGCPSSRECIVVGQTRRCGNCSEGLVRDPLNPGGECVEFAVECLPGYPSVSGNSVETRFSVNPDVDFGSASCRISGQEDVDCSSGFVEFSNLIPRHCPYTLTVLLENVDNSGTSIRRQRKVYVVDNGVCVVNLVGEGITVSGNLVTISFQESGSSSCNEYACRVDGVTVIDPCGGPLSPSGEATLAILLPSGEHHITIYPTCGADECRDTVPVTVDFFVP